MDFNFMFAQSVFGLWPWFAWVAIVAIVSGSISGMLKMWLTHRERIEMIRQGMNPDTPEAAHKSVIGEL